MKKSLTIFCGITIMLLAITTTTVQAENSYQATLTGYTFMGGSGSYQTEPGDTSGKNYFLIGTGNDIDDWAFGWLKFDSLPASPVDSALLELDFYAGSLIAPSETSPMNVAIQAVDADVTDILANPGSYKENHILDGDIAVATLTNEGVYQWDITSLVNGWIHGDPNYGFVITGWNNDIETGYLHPYFAGFPINGASTGNVPVIVTATVPEPSTFALLISAILCGGVMIRKRLAV